MGGQWEGGGGQCVREHPEKILPPTFSLCLHLNHTHTRERTHTHAYKSSSVPNSALFCLWLRSAGEIQVPEAQDAIFFL